MKERKTAEQVKQEWDIVDTSPADSPTVLPVSDVPEDPAATSGVTVINNMRHLI